jgi:hypothetical protein
MSFHITGLPAEDFAALFALSDEELSRRGPSARLPTGVCPATHAASA